MRTWGDSASRLGWLAATCCGAVVVVVGASGDGALVVVVTGAVVVVAARPVVVVTGLVVVVGGRVVVGPGLMVVVVDDNGSGLLVVVVVVAAEAAVSMTARIESAARRIVPATRLREVKLRPIRLFDLRPLCRAADCIHRETRCGGLGAASDAAASGTKDARTAGRQLGGARP